MHVHQRCYQLSRPKPVLQGRFCLMASNLVLLGLLRRRRGDMHVHQRLYQLRRHKLVLQGCLCLRVRKLVLIRLLRRRRGDKLANQQRYQLRRHKPVNQLLFGLRASMHGLRGFCGGGGETCTCTSESTS